jgi:hypothetical protein
MLFEKKQKIQKKQGKQKMLGICFYLNILF